MFSPRHSNLNSSHVKHSPRGTKFIKFGTAMWFAPINELEILVSEQTAGIFVNELKKILKVYMLEYRYYSFGVYQQSKQKSR